MKDLRFVVPEIYWRRAKWFHQRNRFWYPKKSWMKDWWIERNEFKDLYPEESNIETKEYVKDLQIDTDFDYCFRMSTSIMYRNVWVCIMN
jgi:hypothetical protein